MAGLIPAHAGKTISMPVTGDRPRAHPRLRGENLKIGGLFLVAWGSSPLTRGKQASPRSSRKKIGLIPAHAGKTRRGALSALCLPDHPRSRGENVTTVIASPGSPGSSPLTRGKQCEAPGLHEDAGIIPAHAGKTSPTYNATPTTWAHPHSRGENTISSTEPITLGGSSPLTRGKPHRDRVLGHEGGLIPTHTRKTSCPDSSPSPTRAHPRSRGENASNFYVPFQSQGSSPLTRGKPGDRASDRLPRRLIPVHAGKIKPKPWNASSTGAHPRSRRDNVPVSAGSACRFGSSPLTRGKLVDGVDRDRAAGLIPAHAGKTALFTGRPARSWAHPHSRGENVRPRCIDASAAGSPPLTRGKL